LAIITEVTRMNNLNLHFIIEQIKGKKGSKFSFNIEDVKEDLGESWASLVYINYLTKKKCRS